MYKIAKDKHDGVTFDIDCVWGKSAEEAPTGKVQIKKLAFIKKSEKSPFAAEVHINQVVLARGIKVYKTDVCLEVVTKEQKGT